MKIDARLIYLGKHTFYDDGDYDYTFVQAVCSPFWLAKPGGIEVYGCGFPELREFDVTSVTVRKDGDATHIEVLGLVGKNDLRIVRIVFTPEGVDVELGEGILNFTDLHDAVYEGE